MKGRALVKGSAFLFHERIRLVRIRLDIPNRTYAKLKRMATRENLFIEEVILRSIRAMLGKTASPRNRISRPLMESSRPGSLRLDNKKIYEIIDFP
jgi:hypothetical protein